MFYSKFKLEISITATDNIYVTEVLNCKHDIEILALYSPVQERNSAPCF